MGQRNRPAQARRGAVLWRGDHRDSRGIVRFTTIKGGNALADGFKPRNVHADILRNIYLSDQPKR